MSTSPRPEDDDGSDDGQKARRKDAGHECSAQSMSKSKSTSEPTEQESTGTEFSDVGDYEFEQVRQRYEWVHQDTGLQVIISPKAGLRDGYGGVSKGFEVVARDESGQVVDDIHSIHGGTVASKPDAKRMAYEWMEDRPDGELLGTEEVDF